MKRERFGLLNGNTLKIIAAISMTLDHIGVIFFPRVYLLRCLGRLALPIFSFMIAEGCRYTRHRLRYLLSVLLLGTGCQLVYYFVSRSLYLNILLAFSLSILMIYALQAWKRTLTPGHSTLQRCLGAMLFLGSVAGTLLLNQLFVIDYGFWGCMLPLFAALFHFPDPDAPPALKRLDHNLIHVLSLTVGMLLLISVNQARQYFSLLTIPLLLLYSGKRGTHKMKYFFYIFYPLHLALLEGLYMLIQMLR
ncbi:MAG: hypothetical protein IJX62_05860 [Clostridia bacterium]|nr:hypothetical protein [Clostridia bacterium]